MLELTYSLNVQVSIQTVICDKHVKEIYGLWHILALYLVFYYQKSKQTISKHL